MNLILLYSAILFVMMGNCRLVSACTYRASDGSFYDLGALKSEYKFSANSYSFSVKICSALPYPCYGMNQSVCRVAQWGGIEYASGTVDSMIISDSPLGPSSGVEIYYGGGEICSGYVRTSTINLLCDPNVADAVIQSVVDDNRCYLTFNMVSQFACPIRTPCSYTATDGSHYDLSPLISAEFKWTSDLFNYLIVICRDLSMSCYGMRQSVCRISVFGGIEYASGSFSAVTFKDSPNGPNTGVTMIYGGGESCGGAPRTTTIFFECEPGVEGVIYFLEESTACDLTVYLASKYACPL